MCIGGPQAAPTTASQRLAAPDSARVTGAGDRAARKRQSGAASRILTSPTGISTPANPGSLKPNLGS